MMKHYIFYITTSIALAFLLASCEPQIDDKTTLGDPPTEASFTVVEMEDEANTYRFTSTNTDGFLFGWNLGNGTTTSGPEAIGYYPDAGVYIVELTVFNEAGHVTSTQSINVANDVVIEAGPCDEGSLIEFLSDCGQKAWVLNPEEGALLVGPQGLTEVWWQSPAEAVAERTCQFNDEWIFTEDGSMIYDTKGDIWAEDYMGFAFECVTEDLLAPDVAAWASGNHSYTAIGNELAVSGLGAFIGLPKAANGGEVGFPVNGVTYVVTERSTSPTTGNDLMKIQVDFGDGIWQFTLVAI